MNFLPRTAATLALPLTMALGCAADTQTVGPDQRVKTDGYGKADSSVEAIFLDMEFDGELVTDFVFNPRAAIDDQLLYTIGFLNDDNSIGRLDTVQISDIQTSELDNGRTLVTYHAILPVAWGRKNNVPTSHTLRLPRDASFAGLEAFTEKYKDSCVDFSQAHDVDAGSMWYYYRTQNFQCQIDDADVVTLDAAVSVSEINTTGKYPEYHKVWEDDVLRVTAVFGKFEDGATSNFDAGIRAYNRFVQATDSRLAPLGGASVPADLPREPGVELPDVEFSAPLADGKSVVITALLVDNVRTAGATFNERYAALSRDADLIVYNGHAGLGANIRALARKGDWQTGQYAVVFMNGCDTYAYVDSALNDAHAAVNADDETGTKYVDIVTNAMPSFFHSMPAATLALVDGLMAFDAPRTYEQMFQNIDRLEVVLVSGEQDNTFVPGDGGGGGSDWDGMSEAGTVSRDEEHHFSTPTLKAGRYVFELSGTGDADLYVRIGERAGLNRFDCRPFRTGSSELCQVELPVDAAIHVMVRGFDNLSDYALVGNPE